jgi:hypothetical protein
MAGSFWSESRTPLSKRRIAFFRVLRIEGLMAARQLAGLSRNSGSFPAVLTASEQQGVEAWR